MRRSDFYSSYERFKEYHTVKISRRNLREFDKTIWGPLQAESRHRFLELGCGLGHMLFCLHEKGVEYFIGIDSDRRIADHLPLEIRDKFIAGDAKTFFARKRNPLPFDRVLMLDFLEHLSAEEGFQLLRELHGRTSADAKILIRVPNAASPWGLQNQYGDVTHITAYSPGSIKQVATAADWQVCSLFPHKEGSGIRRFTDTVFHGIVSALISRPPEIWSANFFAILEKKRGRD
ncbi:MAG: class I SAM-dependent methyltransferase [Turneriella sp.]|nr:class I SAM-dependent methyltransferase [Turneriella sp.]